MKHHLLRCPPTVPFSLVPPLGLQYIHLNVGGQKPWEDNRHIPLTERQNPGHCVDSFFLGHLKYPKNTWGGRMRKESQVESDSFHYISSKGEKTELLTEILKNEQ